MTSIKLKFRPSKVNGKQGTLYFQVIHDRLTRQIGTGYKVYSHEWGDGGLRFPSGRASPLAKRRGAVEEYHHTPAAVLRVLYRGANSRHLQTAAQRQFQVGSVSQHYGEASSENRESAVGGNIHGHDE